MLQFQVASAIQEAIVREYSEYQENDVSVFAGWLIQYCVHHITFSPDYSELIRGCNDIFGMQCYVLRQLP